MSRNMRQLMTDLCGWHPLRAEEVASLLGKDRKYLRNRHLTAMVQDGTLVFAYPESPNHKGQSYRLPPKQGDDKSSIPAKNRHDMG
jgi:ATP-dependent DNA helicase RecG